MITLRC